MIQITYVSDWLLLFCLPSASKPAEVVPREPVVALCEAYLARGGMVQPVQFLL